MRRFVVDAGRRACPIRRVIELLNRHFVPGLRVERCHERLGHGEGGTKRLYHTALKANLPAGTHSVYIVSPQGQVLDVEHGCRLVEVDAMLEFLCQNLPDLSGTDPVVDPSPQSKPPAAPAGALVLHLTARYLKQVGDELTAIRLPLGERRAYDWKAYPGRGLAGLATGGGGPTATAADRSPSATPGISTPSWRERSSSVSTRAARRMI